jgi:hypothetical protein
VTDADFARELERELAKSNAERDELKAKTDSYDRVRAEYVKWWRHWLDTFDGYEGSAWLSEYAKAMPSAHPDACSDVDDVLRRIDFKIGTAVAELAALKERLAVVEQIARIAPELNPNNYDHDEVCQLNDAMIQVWKEAKR